MISLGGNGAEKAKLWVFAICCSLAPSVFTQDCKKKWQNSCFLKMVYFLPTFPVTSCNAHSGLRCPGVARLSTAHMGWCCWILLIFFIFIWRFTSPTTLGTFWNSQKETADWLLNKWVSPAWCRTAQQQRICIEIIIKVIEMLGEQIFPSDTGGTWFLLFAKSLIFFYSFGILICGAAPCLALTPGSAQGWLFGGFYSLKIPAGTWNMLWELLLLGGIWI